MAIPICVPIIDTKDDKKTGVVVKVLVEVGQTIKKNQDLFVVEAEKGLFTTHSPCDGEVVEVALHDGDVVVSFDPALVVEPFVYLEGQDEKLYHIKKIYVIAGQRVEEGDPLFQLELDGELADVPAECAAIVHEIYIKEGESITPDQDLFNLEEIK